MIICLDLEQHHTGFKSWPWTQLFRQSLQLVPFVCYHNMQSMSNQLICNHEYHDHHDQLVILNNHQHTDGTWLQLLQRLFHDKHTSVTDKAKRNTEERNLITVHAQKVNYIRWHDHWLYECTHSTTIMIDWLNNTGIRQWSCLHKAVFGQNA